MDKDKKDIVLSVKDLVVEYTSDQQIIQAVNGVSFQLERGRTLGFVGETGAGKTTIAKSILRILPNPPAKIKDGEIIYEGEDIMKMPQKRLQQIRGNKISMVFQDPMTALNPVLRVGEQIAEVIRKHDKVNKKESVKRAKEMLEMVGIPAERFREYPHQFSGGMKQRVVIAIALACNPDLLLADEPTTALDVTIQAQVLKMINKLKTEKNTSMIMITHDLGIVAEVCDDVAIIYAGEIIEYGSLEEIYDHPTHPYTRGLFGAVPDLNSDVERLTPIKGMLPDPTNLPEGCKFQERCAYCTEKCLKGDVEVVSLGGSHICKCHYADAMKNQREE